MANQYLTEIFDGSSSRKEFSRVLYIHCHLKMSNRSTKPNHNENNVCSKNIYITWLSVKMFYIAKSTFVFYIQKLCSKYFLTK